MRKYRLVAKKGEGTFSEVLKAQNVKDGKYHAIKCMKNRFESIDQVIQHVLPCTTRSGYAAAMSSFRSVVVFRGRDCVLGIFVISNFQPGRVRTLPLRLFSPLLRH